LQGRKKPQLKKLDAECEKQGKTFSASRLKRDKAVATIDSSQPIPIGSIPVKLKTGDNRLIS
jgi:hypothetical protein